ncbi:hemerythrin domain-containing protein [Sphingomonas sp.]|jgi:hemerythrin superfamily protein|uniref:hemerythrin domain-containing protein n=1 Tax=Sphingomonas sp. TaxID=28214 RepID=UPI002E325ED7|nr:hemerythrin domain-containing protein [Sphingomonas sp.]HEX4693899.1 hemerythrin domain-containing protein [Sphingomonas sp.]
MTTTAQQEKSTSRSEQGGMSTLGVVASAGAAGAVLGVLAMIGRKVAVQAPTYLAGDWDQALAAEHKATLLVFDAIQATPDTAKVKRAMLLANLKHMLAKHALEEENAIYPALRDAGMVAEADELNSEHGYVKQYLYDLENMPNDSARFLETMAKFRADIEQHMREEEDDLFPGLKSQLSEEKNRALTRTMNKEGFKIA